MVQEIKRIIKESEIIKYAALLPCCHTICLVWPVS